MPVPTTPRAPRSPLAPLAARRLPAAPSADQAPPTTTAPGANPTAVDAALPPVILLHGFASTSDADFGDWAADLAGAGRVAYLIDLPGHGHSPAIPAGEAASTASVVAAIAECLDAFGPEEVDVVGYSLGARLAWELPAATGRVRRLVLGGLSPVEPFADVDVVAVARAVDGEPAADPFVGMMAGMVSRPERDADSLLALISGLAAQPFEPDSAGAAVPSVPTLFIAGQDDQLTTGVEALSARVPGARLVRVPGDHREALESAEFRAETLAFLR